jgi:hypothetical protein
MRKRRENNFEMDDNETGREYGTGAGSFPIAGFGISGFEPSNSATRKRVSCLVKHTDFFEHRDERSGFLIT